jgi:hypothetical protein
MRQVFAHERADSLLNYLSRTLTCLEGHFSPPVMHMAAKCIWYVTQQHMMTRLQYGQAMEYYTRIEVVMMELQL